MPLEVDYLTEGATDAIVAEKLIRAAGLVPGTDYLLGSRRRGKQQFDNRVRGLNAGVKHGRAVLALRDHDDDAPCAGDLVRSILSDRDPRLILRIAVRSVEAWLMADRDAYARHFGVRVADVPNVPETIERPKDLLNNWINGSRGKHLTRFVAEQRRYGLANWQIIAAYQTIFVRDVWDVTRARNFGSAPSLNRAFAALEQIGGSRDSTR